MRQMISCLVGMDGTVYAINEIHSHSEIVRTLGVNEDDCLKYEYDLRERKLIKDFNLTSAPFKAKKSHDDAARRFFDKCASTPEKLIAFVRRGNFDYNALVSLLTPKAREEYHKNKTVTEAKEEFYKTIDKALEEPWAAEYTEAIKKYKKTVAEAKEKWDKAKTEVWVKLFENPENRIEAWKK